MAQSSRQFIQWKDRPTFVIRIGEKQGACEQLLMWLFVIQKAKNLYNFHNTLVKAKELNQFFSQFHYCFLLGSVYNRVNQLSLNMLHQELFFYEVCLLHMEEFQTMQNT